MSLQLMSEINDNFHMACALHRELSDTLFFVGLQGYSNWNEFQLLDELATQRRIRQYIMTTYSEIVPDKLPKSANITEPLVGGKNRESLKMDEKWKIVRESFRIWQEWEEATIEKMERISSQVLANGKSSTFNFIGKLIEGVKAELDYLKNKVSELSAMDWDMTQIVAEQPDYFERYERLISELLGKSEMFHHNNSALDSRSRAFFKTPPDN